jgi:hypothetical protein
MMSEIEHAHTRLYQKNEKPHFLLTLLEIKEE